MLTKLLMIVKETSLFLCQHFRRQLHWFRSMATTSDGSQIIIVLSTVVYYFDAHWMLDDR